MKHITSLSAWALAAALALLSPLANASPVSFSFEGTVTGSTAISHSAALFEFPISTPASFDLTFVPTWSEGDLAPASGHLTLGTKVWQLDHAKIDSILFNWYYVRFTGTGPTIKDDGQLFGLVLRLTQDLDVTALYADFVYPVVSPYAHNTRSYINLAGQFKVTETPEPASWALIGLGLAGLASARRRRSV